jgi:hypothetical protein
MRFSPAARFSERELTSPSSSIRGHPLPMQQKPTGRFALLSTAADFRTTDPAGDKAIVESLEDRCVPGAQWTFAAFTRNQRVVGDCEPPSVDAAESTGSGKGPGVPFDRPGKHFGCGIPGQEPEGYLRQSGDAVGEDIVRRPLACLPCQKRRQRRLIGPEASM